MTPSPTFYPIQRTPRIKLAGSVLALILPENQHQVRARLHQLSFNGGLLHLAEPLDPETKAELIFHLGSTTVRTFVGTLPPMWATDGCLQPFRFTGLNAEDRRQMEEDLQTLLGISRYATLPPSQEEYVSPEFNSSDPQIDAMESAPVAAYSEEVLAEIEHHVERYTPPTQPLESNLSPRLDSQEPVRSELFVPASANAQPIDEPVLPSEVVLYFESPQDALRFTMAASAVLSSDVRACPSGELAKLFREFEKVSRVRTAAICR
jgi:hypothetical protein